MKLLYFAWVRERIGKAEEQVEPPADIATVGELMAWLAGLAGATTVTCFSDPISARSWRTSACKAASSPRRSSTGVCACRRRGQRAAAITRSTRTGTAAPDILRP